MKKKGKKKKGGKKKPIDLLLTELNKASEKKNHSKSLLEIIEARITKWTQYQKPQSFRGGIEGSQEKKNRKNTKKF